MSKFDAVRDDLKRRRSELEGRLRRIGKDMRRSEGPLDADSEEQAVELENAPVLDALDATGHDELTEIDAALERIAAGRFGVCSECGEDIPLGRLQAIPTARTCTSCAA